MQLEIRVLVLGGTAEEAQLWQAELENVEYQTKVQGVSSLEQLNQYLQELDWDLMLVKLPPVLRLEDVQQKIQAHHLSLPILVIADQINNDVILEGLSLGFYRCLPSSGVARYLAKTARAAIEANRTSREKEEAQRIVEEIKQAEQKVRTSEQRFRVIFENSSLGISLTSLQGYSIQYNTAFRDMFGYSYEELKTLTFMDMTHPEDAEPHRSLIQEVLAGKRNGFTLDKRYLKKNGDVLWGRLNVSVVRNPQGDPLFAISMVENITERKLAEENLRRAKVQLQRMIRMSPVVIFSLDPVNPDNVLFVSENLSLQFGYDEADFYKGIEFWSNLVHPDDLPHVIEAFNHQLAGEQLDLEFRLRNRVGEYRWIHENVSLLSDDTGKPVELIGTIMDITRRRSADIELRQALEKEKELNELKTRFISIASHEFRTPLSTIMSSAELIEHYGKGWPENKRVEHLHRIQTAVLLLTGMLEEMLMLEKGETSSNSYQPENVHLINFIKQVVDEIELLDRDQHIFEVNQRVENPFILTDEKLLRPIMVNLLTNAVKYTKLGGLIRVDVAASPENIIIQVQDSGIGIPEADLPHIFEPFHRCSNAGTIPGTGLGLTIVKRHLDLLKGTVEVTSQECIGTTFRINLPFQPEANVDAQSGA